MCDLLIVQVALMTAGAILLIEILAALALYYVFTRRDW